MFSKQVSLNLTLWKVKNCWRGNKQTVVNFCNSYVRYWLFIMHLDLPTCWLWSFIVIVCFGAVTVFLLNDIYHQMEWCFSLEHTSLSQSHKVFVFHTYNSLQCSVSSFLQAVSVCDYVTVCKHLNIDTRNTIVMLHIMFVSTTVHKCLVAVHSQVLFTGFFNASLKFVFKFNNISFITSVIVNFLDITTSKLCHSHGR